MPDVWYVSRVVTGAISVPRALEPPVVFNGRCVFVKSSALPNDASVIRSYYRTTAVNAPRNGLRTLRNSGKIRS